MGNRLKSILKTGVKLALSGLALYIVFRSIDLEEVSKLLAQANYLYLFLATGFFVLSKIVSAYRLQEFFYCISLNLDVRFNLKLYWVGMFYNLFLPGGIGGDGYKVIILKKRFGTEVKHLIQAALVDRISGLVSLLFLIGVGLLIIPWPLAVSWPKTLVFVAVLLVFPSFVLLCKLVFKRFKSAAGKSILFSIPVQLLQVASAVAILWGLGVNEDLIAYCVLFLVSSFVSIIPFTIGGLGSRELTFLIGYEYLGIGETASISLSLVFTLITALVSFFGIFIKLENTKDGV